jgi:hypothetical protein
MALVAELVLGCRDPVKYPWMVVPGERLGPIPVDVSEKDLRDRFGAQVQNSPYALGEGSYVPGTILFPRDPTRRIEIAWRDTVGRRGLKTVRFEGDASVWELEGRIRLGTDLFELERLNGGPFTMAGFGWDQQGVVLSWEGGALTSSMRGVYLYLVPSSKKLATEAYRRVAGDKALPSDDGDLRVIDPRVARIVVAFDIEAPR